MTVDVGVYNYAAFTRSQTSGRSNGFRDLLRAGDEAPDFELPTPEGKPVRLSSFRGHRHVLLEFGSIT